MGPLKAVLYLLVYCGLLTVTVIASSSSVTYEVHSIDDVMASDASKKQQTAEATTVNDTLINTVFLDNLHRPYPVFDMSPFTNIIKGISDHYKTIILDSLPMVPNFPPRFDDNIYFHFPQVAAEQNKKLSPRQSPLKMWIHPHLHIPYLPLSEKEQKRFSNAKPIDVAFYMANKANSVYPGTVIGILTTSIPLHIQSYREDIPKFKAKLAKKKLKFGLLIESYKLCENVHGIHQARKLFYQFDEFYYHQPEGLKEEDKTGSKMEDALLEGKAFDVLFRTCKDVLERYIPKGKEIKPVRGFLRAKYAENEEGIISRMKFNFDVIRI